MNTDRLSLLIGAWLLRCSGVSHQPSPSRRGCCLIRVKFAWFALRFVCHSTCSKTVSKHSSITLDFVWQTLENEVFSAGTIKTTAWSRSETNSHVLFQSGKIIPPPTGKFHSFLLHSACMEKRRHQQHHHLSVETVNMQLGKQMNRCTWC